LPQNLPANRLEKPRDRAFPSLCLCAFVVHFLSLSEQTLPQPLDNSFQREIKRFEEEKIMPYVTSIERLGIQTGRLTSCQKHIIDILEIRFEVVPSPLRETINKLEDINQLENLLKQAVTIASLADFQQLINS
jgi:hypothetical protein